jgi:DNA ligase D-like protein (predicted 3'-phosphoesterase)
MPEAVFIFQGQLSAASTCSAVNVLKSLVRPRPLPFKVLLIFPLLPGSILAIMGMGRDAFYREGMMKKGEKLKEYIGKRDFSKTSEPKAGSEKSSKKPIFVIQQHDASHMHFDFRLEVDGVLASWAVPKGPSTSPQDKRLAVRTEDHPLAYADFEGSIPEGEYGAGVVIVWDTGEFENASQKDGKEISLEKALAEGIVKVKLHGKKLKGGYALIHTKMRGDEKNWLLVKEKDEDADARRNPVATEPESVLSGKTIEEMKKRMEKG